VKHVLFLGTVGARPPRSAGPRVRARPR
jgi:hypothetical protein